MRLMERIGRREQAGDEAVVDFYLGGGVLDDDPCGSNDRDLNRFPMRAVSSGRQPRFCGLGDTAVYVNFASNQATFTLAEVPVVHAGKDLVIDLWDPDSGNSGVRMEMPDGTLPLCTWTSADGNGSGGSLIPCDISGCGTQHFDDDYMQIRIAIPDAYARSLDCWSTIRVTYNGGTNDATTWSDRIEDNPVRLVE